jgi:hypothetical protein
MSVFPKLKTGVIAQYPATRELRFSTEIQQFLDTSEQRYRDLRTTRKRWVIDLAQLDEGELAQVLEFFVDRQGRLGTFDFEDPWTGGVVNGCRFEHDNLPLQAEGELDGSAQVTIVETIQP